MKKNSTNEGCEDSNCPFHGSLSVRGKSFVGTVVASKAMKTASVEWSTKHFIPKYERYENKKTKVKAHNPPCIKAKDGDVVIINECRPLSKTKRFVITKNLSVKNESN